MAKEPTVKCIDESCDGLARTVDVRHSGPQDSIRRRKICNKCGLRFTTWESTIAPKVTSGMRDLHSIQLMQIKEILKGNPVKQFKRAPRGLNLTQGKKYAERTA